MLMETMLMKIKRCTADTGNGAAMKSNAIKNAAFLLAILAAFSGIFLAAFSPAIAPAHAQTYGSEGSSAIAVSLAKYEPFPAEAGKYAEIWLKVENVGKSASGNVELNAVSKFPFSVDSEDSLKSLGSIPSGGVIITSYRVKVDEKAVSGDNIFSVKYRASSASSWIENDLTVSVQVHDAVISVENVGTQKMVPGRTQPVAISLENLADAYLKDISVSLDLSAAATPFAPADSVNEKRIVSLASKQKANLSFEILTSPDALSGVYKIPLALKYSDTSNKSYTRNYIVGLVVNSAPDFVVYIQKSDILTEGSSGTVTLSISNTGPESMKFLSMELMATADYETIGENAIYLGNINPDDYQTAAFKIHVKPGSLSGNKTIPLFLSLYYRDGLNNIYKQGITKNLRVYTPEEITALGLAPNTGGYSIVYIIVALVAVYYLYKKFRKKKQ